MEEILESETIHETKTFTITGVQDPRTKVMVNMFQAITDNIINQHNGTYCNPDTGESMPLPDAMNKGFIHVEFITSSVEQGELKKGVITTGTPDEMVQYKATSVMDPSTGQSIGVQESIEKGIIDQRKASYSNPATGHVLPLKDAIQKGLVSVDSSIREERAMRWIYIELIVSGVWDPTSGTMLQLDEALKRGLIDKSTGVYIDPNTTQEIPLDQAMDEKLIDARLADPIKDKKHTNLVRCRVQQNLDIVDFESGKLKALEVDINKNVFNKIMESVNTNETWIRDHASKENMSLDEGFLRGYFGVNPLVVADSNAHKYSIQLAAAHGLIQEEFAVDILKLVSTNSVETLMKHGIFDSATGMFVDRHGSSMSIGEAIAKGLIDPDKIFYSDPDTGYIMSLSKAIEDGHFSVETGRFVDSSTNCEVTMEQVTKRGTLGIPAHRVVQQIDTLRFLKRHMVTSVEGMHVGPDGLEVTVEEAVTLGAVQLSPPLIKDHLGQSHSIQAAAALGIVEPTSALLILQAMEQNSLETLIQKGMLNTTTGQYYDKTSERAMSLAEAIDEGLLIPEHVFVTDGETKQIYSLKYGLDFERLDATTGQFKDPYTGHEFSVAQAIEIELIQPSVDSRAILGQDKPPRRYGGQRTIKAQYRHRMASE